MSETLTPVFRLEYFIVAAANGTPCDLEPIFNEEKYLHAIAGASVDLPMPVGRTQEYLAKLAGMDVEIPDKPIYRTEYYLAHMIDNTVECPAPIFREEMFYYEWASNEYVTISGNPVSFTAKAAPLRQLSVAFSPVQDLHGYDNPWPAGGGKNKLPDSDRTATVYDVTMVESKGKFTFTGTATGSGGRYVLKTPSFSLKAGTYYAKVFNETGSAIPTLIVQRGAEYFSGAGAFTLTEDTDDVNIAFNVANGSAYNCSAYVGVFTENVTTYSPYSNECPILGWDSLNVEQRGVNMWDEETESGYIRTTDGVPVPDPSKIRMKNPVPVKANTTYYYKTPVAFYICCYDSNMTFIGRVGGSKDATFTTPANCAFIRAGFEAAYGTTYNHDISINYPATDTAYHAYNPLSRSISISLGSTVYSGWVDVISGVGEVDKAYRLLNNASKWKNSSGTTDFFYDEDYTDRKLFPSSYTGVICSYVQIREQSGVAYGRWQAATGTRFGIKENGTGLTLEEVKAAATAGEIAICYELATPIPIQLTPQEVQSLLGDNVLFSDANGDLTVTYRSN